MSNFIDLSGKRFVKLVVIKREENASNGDARWLCRCDCGKYKTIRGAALNHGLTVSCGCYHKEIITNKNNKNYRHGKCKSRLYNIYNNMKARCYNKNHKSYKIYGAREIIVCKEWLNKENGFINFYNWAISNGYRDDLTIDRINVNGNYEPNNCRWATYREQANNTRTNHYVIYKNKKYTLSELSRKFNINYDLLKKRTFREQNNIIDI